LNYLRGGKGEEEGGKEWIPGEDHNERLERLTKELEQDPEKMKAYMKRRDENAKKLEELDLYEYGFALRKYLQKKRLDEKKKIKKG
jgi:hypothetical protein